MVGSATFGVVRGVRRVLGGLFMMMGEEGVRGRIFF